MKKRIVAMMLCLSMVVASLSACGSGEKTADSQKEESSVSEESTASNDSEGTGEDGAIALDAFAGTEITIAVLKSENDLSEDISEKAGAKLAEEATGIKVNWIAVDSTTANEKVATLLAGDMPDMLIGLVAKDTITQNLDLFYDLSEEGLLETYAPDVYEDYNNSAEAWDAITWTDGSVRALLTNSETNWNAQARGIYYINKTWLDQLGLEVPNTTEELYEALCAFRDNDMNGNGDTTDEFPFEFCQGHYASLICLLANFFGIAGEGEGNLTLGKMVKDGNVVSTLDTQEYRDYLEYAHKLAAEGLMDVEGFSQSYEQFGAKLSAGLVGVFSGWSPETYMDAEMASNYVMLSPVQAYDDVEFVQTGKLNSFAAGTQCTISAATENVEACLWWWNYLSSSMENNYTAVYGAQDDTWRIDENGLFRTKTSDEIDLPDGWTWENYTRTAGLLPGGIGPFISLADQEMQYSDRETVGKRSTYVKEILDYILDEYPPSRMVDPDKTEELNDLTVELEAYLDNFVSTSIMEGITDADWEAHLKQLEILGYQDFLDWYQGYVDGEF